MSSTKPNIIALVDAAWGSGEAAESGEGIGGSTAHKLSAQAKNGQGGGGETRSGSPAASKKARSKRPAGKKAVRRPSPPPRRP